MMDDQAMAALRRRVHARPDVRRALAAEQDAAIYGHRLSPGQRAAVVRRAYREEWAALSQMGDGAGIPGQGGS